MDASPLGADIATVIRPYLVGSNNPTFDALNTSFGIMIASLIALESPEWLQALAHCASADDDIRVRLGRISKILPTEVPIEIGPEA